jgi:hypothetical protein
MPDARHLVYREDVTATNRDIMIAPLDSPAAARPLAATTFNERGLALSPDGRWLAYTSNVSGANEVYVRRLDEASPRWRVSQRGGREPRWRADGRELFFRGGDTLFVVDVRLGAEPQLGQPRPLFAGLFASSTNEALYDVSRDGQRFVMVRDVTRSEGNTIHVMLHALPRLRGRGAAVAP